MTIFRFDFQDLIVFAGMRQPANRVVYIGQSFPGRYPVIVLVAFTLLAHLSERFLKAVLLRFTNNAIRRDLEKRGMHQLQASSCAPPPPACLRMNSLRRSSSRCNLVFHLLSPKNTKELLRSKLLLIWIKMTTFLYISIDR